MPLETPNGLRSILRAVGSLWFAAVLLVLLLVAMACATVFESTHGTEQALASFYYSWWFESLLFLLGASVLAALLLRFPYSKRQIGFVLTHTSILVTFGGALVTKHFAMNGQVGIAEGQTVDQFNVGRDALTVASDRGQNRSTVDLADSLGGRFRPTDIRDAPPLTLGSLRVEIARYLPDSEWVQRVFDDSPAHRPAVEVTLSPNGRDEPTWVFAGQTTAAGGVHVSYRQLADPDELEKLVNLRPSTRPASKGVVRIEYEGSTYEFPVEEGLDKPRPLGETGYTARVLRYLPHATVGPDNKVVNASSRPVNPYIEVELAGPESRETRKAFAKFPEFESIHGASRITGLKLSFVAGDADVPATPVEVVGGPNGELYVRFARDSSKVVAHKLDVGTAVESPWPDRKLTVLRRYEHARVEWSLEPVEPVRKERRPAILVRLSTPEHASERWLQKHRRVPVSIEGVSYELTYAEKVISLGFSVTLDRFRIGYYPGSQRPRSFESQITVTEPGTARTLSRVVSMNHPVSFGGYTFYQSSYRQERGQTVSFLSVSRDPGQPIVFAGYIGLMGGMVVVLGTRMAERRLKPA